MNCINLLNQDTETKFMEKFFCDYLFTIPVKLN